MDYISKTKIRPTIICHMMCTIDGKITGAGNKDIMSDEYFGLYTKTEDMLPSHTGWMCGRVTMQLYFAANNHTPLTPTTEKIDSTDFIAPHSGNLYMFAVDTKGVLRWKGNNITLTNVPDPLHLVVIVTTSTPKDYLGYLQDNDISYLIAGDKEIDFQKLFSTMKEKLGVERLLLEGGGLINGSVMAAGFVDEVSLLVTPLVVNQCDAPSVFEQKNTEPLHLTHYSLISASPMEKNTVLLRYKKQ